MKWVASRAARHRAWDRALAEPPPCKPQRKKANGFSRKTACSAIKAPDSEFPDNIRHSQNRVIGILLKGLQGPVKVEGAQFNGAMPAWEKQLTDEKIANILTYVRSEWGNSAPEITPEQVGAGRKEFASRADPWNEADLLAIPPDAQFEGGKPAASSDQANAAAPAVGGEQKK
jgi:hypothetical protein